MPYHPTLRVLIVDDEYIVRDALATALRALGGIEVVGLAENGLDGIEQHKKLLPDVVLIDADMPRVDGITATRYIHKSKAHSRIIGLMTFGDDPLLQNAMLDAGASLCLSKQDSLETLERALKTVTHTA
jgi:DNA-binding NarL/FixJ family response regulator